MSNTLLTIGDITNEALAVLENQLMFTKHVNRTYDDRYGKEGAKIGDTANIRKPARFEGRRTPTINVEGFEESSVALTLDTQYGCDVSFTTKELTLDIDEFSSRILAPQIATVANMIDYDGMQLYKDIYNSVGTPGVTPATNLVYLNAGVKLDNEAAPRDGNRAVVMNPQAQATIVNANSSLFNPTQVLSEQYTTGTMGIANGFKNEMDQNVGVHTVGVHAGTPLVNGAVSSGSTIVTDGWVAANTLTHGDVFTVAGVYAVNPQNRQSTGQLRQFVVTSLATADVSGNMTIGVYPAIVTSGKDQTVNAGLANNAAITVVGTTGIVTPQNLAFHRDAFAFATADLELPKGVWMAKRVKSDRLGVSMRCVKAYDITNDRAPMRIDVLGGWKTIRAELATRVQG